MLKVMSKDYCTVDSNGRFKFPSSLKKQLISVIDSGFVIRESIYGNYLELYPMNVWEEEIEKIRKRLNPYNPKDIILIRKLSEGNRVELDNNDRLLIPTAIRKKAKIINKDIILVSG